MSHAESPSDGAQEAVFPLHDQFIETHQRISLGDRALVAIAAHVEVRAVLRQSRELMSHDLNDILVGSYARKVSIWPGKDVDVFGRLMAERVDSVDPETAYSIFVRALEHFARQGRLTSQPRSLKVEFGPGSYPSVESIRFAAGDSRREMDRVEQVITNLPAMEFEFSVDVVPAVRWDDHYGIPEIGLPDAQGQRARTGAWCRTDPVALTEETQIRNREPRVAGIGAYVRVVKSIRQIKSHHLPETKPSSLYYEFILQEGFRSQAIRGETWADITSSAISYVAARLSSAERNPVRDPILDQPYDPMPSVKDLDAAGTVFERLARHARNAVSTPERCQAAIDWRSVFGCNQLWSPVFPLPPGCRSTGVEMGVVGANVASGGSEERSFGGH